MTITELWYVKVGFGTEVGGAIFTLLELTTMDEFIFLGDERNLKAVFVKGRIVTCTDI
ncbi:10573_t:CDS:2 [Entrophospora sp. SA101]|nr:4663_t:CDS:2 [Entrophospora sp. SA101]CAJ0766165.1 10573_t:CDS:2 [Entrophospora sp. SA101]CAJ0912914.1 17935_t:CDS:2 [Entrophospora sp. SA101]